MQITLIRRTNIHNTIIIFDKHTVRVPFLSESNHRHFNMDPYGMISTMDSLPSIGNTSLTNFSFSLFKVTLSLRHNINYKNYAYIKRSIRFNVFFWNFPNRLCTKELCVYSTIDVVSGSSLNFFSGESFNINL